MFKRTRDKLFTKVQERISYEDWVEITDKWATAVGFFKGENRLHVMLRDALKTAEDIIMENRVHEVHEIHTVTDIFQKVFITPQKVQVDELVGQIKLIRGIFEELNSWVTIKEEAESREAAGKTIIERNRDKRV